MKWRLRNGKEVINKPITIYFFPNKPNLPWVINSEPNNQNPWASALDMLLNWGVRGFSDTTAISTKITEYVFNNNRFKYDINKGATKLNDEYGIFKCTDFIENVNGTGDIIVNCTDCATIVSTFSNLLGANLYQVKFGGGNGFYCNKVKIIGYDSIWQYPFPNGKDFYDTTATSGGFGYHEVAFNGNYSYEDKIYDACLKVNSYALNPMRSASERLPLNLQFALYDPYTSQISGDDIDRIKYREMLLLNDKNNLNNGAIINNSARRRKFK